MTTCESLTASPQLTATAIGNVPSIAPWTTSGKPVDRACVLLPEGDQTMGSWPFEASRAAVPRATPPAPRMATLIDAAPERRRMRSSRTKTLLLLPVGPIVAAAIPPVRDGVGDQNISLEKR